MATDPKQVVRMYTKDRLTMEDIAGRLRITKQRVHQILRAEDVDTSHGAVARPSKAPAPKEGKAYRAYQMTEQTMGLVERLALAIKDTRTAAVTRAVEELADRLLPGWREEAQGKGGAGEGKKQGKGRRGGTA